MPRTEHIRTSHQRYDHPTACYIHHTEITMPFLHGDTTPHTTNSYSLWEFLNGLSCDWDQNWSSIWFFSSKQYYLSERVAGRCDDTSWQEASEILCIHTPLFLRDFSNNKIAKKTRKCSLQRMTNVTTGATHQKPRITGTAQVGVSHGFWKLQFARV